jgi:selenocysteine lyase/cysteine desulfurase
MTPIPREAFAHGLAYLDHAGVAPIPRRAADAMRACVERIETQGVLDSQSWLDQVERLRGKAARLCGVPRQDVAFVKNTTEGLSFVANGIDWQPGDRVVVPDLEFPSTIYPWLALQERGVVVERLQPVGEARALPVELFEDALRRGPVRLVATSWVQFGRGWRVDLASLGPLCREHGAMLCVDAIQGLGVLPARFEAWGVDFAAADAHKWLCGPSGIGIFYVRGERRAQLRPLEPGWASVAHREEWDNLDLVFDDSARRFEGGSFNHVGAYGLEASIDMLLEAEGIWPHVDAITAYAAGRLEDAGFPVLSDRGEGRSGVLTFATPGREPGDISQALRNRGVVCSGPRGGGVRISPHGYATPDDIDRLISTLVEIR